MTTDELKKEAKNYAKRLFDEEEQAYLHDMVVRVYVESAEPREKRITELEGQVTRAFEVLEGKRKRIAELQKDKDYFSDALDKQIEATFKLDKENAKAKELLAKWVELFKPKSETALSTPIQVDTEQFLSEVEK